MRTRKPGGAMSADVVVVDFSLCSRRNELQPQAVTLVTSDGERRTRMTKTLPSWPTDSDRLVLLVWTLWGDEANLVHERQGLETRELRFDRIPSDQEARSASVRLKCLKHWKAVMSWRAQRQARLATEAG